MTLRVTPDEIVARSSSPLLVTAPWWKRCRLGDIATITNGGAFKSNLFNTTGDGLPLIRIRDVGKTETKTYYSGEYDNKYIIRPGDLLIGMDGDFRISSWQGPISLLNQRVCKLSVTDDSMYCHSLLEYIVQPYLDEVNKLTSAVTVKHLSSRTVADLPIPLPPRVEQEQIVNAIEEHFSRIDVVESAAQTALAKLDTLRQTILTAAFSGRLVDQDPDDESASILLKRIAAERPQHLTRHVAQGINQVSSPMTELLPSGWAIAELGDLCKVEYGKGLSKKQRIGTGTVEVYGSAGLSGYHNEALMDEPVVIVGRKGNAGMVWVTQGPSWPIDTTYFLRPPQGVSAKYLSLQLGHLDLVKKDSSTTIPSLRRPDLETTTIAIAPSSEQEQIIAAIEEHFSRIDAAKASLERCLQRCSVLRRAVLSAAFSGRLIEQDPNDEPASALLERIAAEQPKHRTRKKSA